MRTPRVYEELNDKEIRVGCCKVQRVIETKYKPQTTKADPYATALENLLNQNFTV